MAEPTNYLPGGWWAKNFDEIDTEIARLALVCQIRILEPGAIDRVLRNDASVCGTDNRRAFAKLHNLLLLHFGVHERSVESLGEALTAQIESYVVGRLKERFGHLFGD